MREIDHFTDLRHEGWCLHCARSLAVGEGTRDHVPTKTLLKRPYPANLPLIRVCDACNQGFSDDEQYFVSFLSATLTGSTDPDAQVSPSAKGILRYRADLRADIEGSKRQYTTVGGETRVVWRPDQPRIERVALKNARGHAMFELGEPMLDQPSHVLATPLSGMTTTEREEFERGHDTGLWPEVGSRMMTRLLTGEDMEGQWVVLQEGIYRYSVTQEDGVVVRSVICGYLATEIAWD